MIFVRTEKGSQKVESWEDITNRPRFMDQISKAEHILSEIIGFYQFKDEIHCGLKGCNQPHQRGYLVRTEEGIETNIGNICGTGEFGIQFKELTGNFHKFMDFETNKMAIYEAKQQCDSWSAIIHGFRKSKPSIDTCASHIEKIQNANYAGRLAAAEIRLLAKSQNGIVKLTEVETSKLAKEILFSANKHMRESGEATSEYTIGKVSFTNVLLPENNLKVRFNMISEDIKHIREIILESASSPTVTDIARRANTVEDRIKQLKLLLHEAKKFLSIKNLSAITNKLKYSSTAPESELRSFETFLRTLNRK